MLYFLRSKHTSHSIDSLSKLQSKWLVTMSVSLRTQTGLHHPIIQVLYTRVCFIDIWYTSLTFVHYLEHRLAIVEESFSPLSLDYTTSFVKVQIRSDATSHTILSIQISTLKTHQKLISFRQTRLQTDLPNLRLRWAGIRRTWREETMLLLCCTFFKSS